MTAARVYPLALEYGQMLLEILIVTALIIHQLIYLEETFRITAQDRGFLIFDLYNASKNTTDWRNEWYIGMIGERLWIQNGWDESTRSCFWDCFFVPSLCALRFDVEKVENFCRELNDWRICYWGSWIFNETSSLSCCWPLDFDEQGNHLRSFSGQNLMNTYTQPIPLKWIY